MVPHQRRRKPSARLRAEAAHLGGLRGAATNAANRRNQLLARLALEPLAPGEFPPKPKKIKAKITRRVIRRCKGVVVRRAGYEHRCNRKILISLTGGRPTVRCPDCRILKIYWLYLHHTDPIPVILTLESLASRGLIGREQYRRLQESRRTTNSKEL